MTERKYKIQADVDVEVLATSKKEAVEKAKNALQFLDIISFRVLPQKGRSRKIILYTCFLSNFPKNVWTKELK